MAEAVSLAEALAGAPSRRMRRRLYRCVPYLDFERGKPPTYLHSSGRAGRCNPAGVRALYFAEDQAVAEAEYRLMWRGQPAEHQPKLTFTAEVRLAHVLDLQNTATLSALALRAEHLHEQWRRRPRTRLQELGEAVSGQRTVAAIRFPSQAARRLRRSGWNVAIFPDAVSAPDRVEILGTADEPLEVIP
jgi:RES domain-containing protein